MIRPLLDNSFRLADCESHVRHFLGTRTVLCFKICPRGRIEALGTTTINTQTTHD
jgi:hypothetical protein